jgi:hypothetical protein
MQYLTDLRFYQLLFGMVLGDAIPASSILADSDIKIVLSRLLLSFEMLIFTGLYFRAYWYKEYTTPNLAEYQGGKLGWLALAQAINIMDIGKAIIQALHYLALGFRRRHRVLETENSTSEFGSSTGLAGMECVEESDDRS